MPISHDELVSDRAHPSHAREVQDETDHLPSSSGMAQCSSHTATAAIRASPLDQVRRPLYIVDREVEAREVFDLLVWSEGDRRMDAPRQPSGPPSTESAVAVIDEQLRIRGRFVVLSPSLHAGHAARVRRGRQVLVNARTTRAFPSGSNTP